MNGLGIQNDSPNAGPDFATVIPNQPLYMSSNISGVTQAGQIQYLNPNAFRSVVDTSTGACYGGTSSANCQFGDGGRNSLTASGFLWMDLSVGKNFKLSERFTFRFEGDFYNLLNHPNFNYPSTMVGIPGELSTLTGVGTIDSEVSPATGLPGSFLGGDSAVHMIALSAKFDF